MQDQQRHLVVVGNGMLLASTDRATLIRTIDRFIMFYIRTADRLQRTASWLQSLDGGLDYLRSVIVDDSLGISGELDAAVARHVERYEDEWAAVLVPLSSASMALLRELSDKPGHVVSRSALLKITPGDSSDEHAVEVAVGRLRNALGDPRIIQTVVRRGYRLAYEPERASNQDGTWRY